MDQHCVAISAPQKAVLQTNEQSTGRKVKDFFMKPQIRKK